MADLEVVPPADENLVAWRLGRLEKALEELAKKFDAFQDLSKAVTINTEKIASLEKSRDRLIAALSIVSTGLIALVFQRITEVI